MGPEAGGETSGGPEAGGDRLDGEAVPVAAEPDDGARRDRSDHGGAPPRLPGVGVGEVQLDDRPVERGERVVDPPRVVVNAPGLMMIAAQRPRAAWISSISSPSWLD